MTEEIKIEIGWQPETDKWHAVMIFRDGRTMSTGGFDTREDCRRAVDEYLKEKTIEHSWQEARS